MECPNGCLSPMEIKKDERLFHRNGLPIVISDLTIYVCPECGQESMPLPSARIVENVLKGTVSSSGKFTAELYEMSCVG
ncbi:MAG: hypothetical protein QME42_08890 [bacterium]|nr:hypothetical protein [bacterium]